MPSAVMIRGIEPRCTSINCTGRTGSASFSFSFPQPARNKVIATPAAMKVVFPMGSEPSRQCLDIRQREPIARQAIIVSIAGQGQSALRVDDFERRRLAALITQERQAKAFTRKVGRVPKRVELRLRGLPLEIESGYVRFDLAPGEIQVNFCLPPLQLRLPNFASCRAPIPDRHVDRGLDYRPEITAAVGIVKGEEIGIHAIEIIDDQRGIIQATRGLDPEVRLPE